jgi:hypothetical protein
VGHRWYKKRFIDHERKFKDVLNRIRKFVFATVNDNRFVNPDYRGNLEELTGAEKRAYLDGDWDVSAGAFFEEWRHEIHVIAPFTPPKHWTVWASMDYGFNHWNVILLHTKYDGIIYTFDELAHRKHYPTQIVPELRQRLAEHWRSLHDLTKFIAGSDVFAKTGATEKSVAEQYEELGIKITSAEMAAGSRVGGARHLGKLLGKPSELDPSKYMDARWKITESCSHLIETLPSLESDPNNGEDVLKIDADDKGVGGDDAYDAARYGLYDNAPERLTVRTQTYAG